ncbi:MAG: TniQ family protein [Lentisphaerae bacterium]|nr:TniQ family protein [Lentisphaerota bacterium]
MTTPTAFIAKPLLQRSPLFPGESLLSLLARLALLNHYPSLAVLEEVLQFHWPDSLDAPSSSSAFERLEQLTRIPAMDLWMASDHALTPAAFPALKKNKKQTLSRIQEAMQWLPKPQVQDFHPAKASWYCPKCLEEEAYQRLSWRPAAMAACLQHGCLLLDRCPGCQQAVSILGLVLARCPTCQADLRQAETVPVAEDRWGWTSQATLLGWRMNSPLADPGNGYPEQLPALLCSLAEGLAVGALFLSESLPSHPLKPAKPLKLHRLNDARLHALPPQVFWAYSRALEFMTHWPDEFRTFLYLAAPEPENNLLGNLGLFYSYWIPKRWEHLDYNFIQEALEDFWRDRAWFAQKAYTVPVPFAQVPCFASLKEAASILNIPENALIRLGQISLVTEIFSPAEKHTTRFYRRSDLRKLKQSWAQPLSLQEACYWLGCSPETILRLTKERVLKMLPGSKANMHYAKTDVANLIAKVDDYTLVADGEDDNLISLADAAQQLSCVHFDEARLIQLVISHKLRSWRSSTQQKSWACNEISFLRKDLDVLMSQKAKEKGWISAEDAAFDLKFEDEIFLGWIARGLLKTIASYNGQPYLKQKDFDQFRAEHIFFYEARDLLGISTRRLMGYVRRGKLAPIAGPDLDGCYIYVFPLRKVERLARHLQKLQQKRGSATILV